LKIVYIFLFLNFIFLQKAFSFPEMVRHGYGNCISCHSSPNGGGLLTPYGRALSKELLSAKSNEKIDKEELFLKGWLTPPAKFEFGGDIRFLQLFMDNKYESSGRAILMQADLEVQYTLDPRTKILTTIGRLESNTVNQKLTDNIISRRHWINQYIGPDENKERYQVRIGRFFPAYGLNIPEHNTVIRKGLGFDQNQESYNAEISYIGPDWNIFTTIIAGRPDKKELDRESGGAISISKIIDNKSKLGFSFYSGNGTNHSSLDRRSLIGINSINSITNKTYALFEIDRSYSPRKSYGYYEYLKLGHEYFQGLHFFISGEYEKPSAIKSDKKILATSVGVQYFPFVHWEISSSFRREKNTFYSNENTNIILLNLHTYL
jgi:hypothetical protein